MTAPAIKIRNLRKSFGLGDVLCGLDLDIMPGKINFIIGQSGGGKSVLLKHLVGLLEPDEGEIWFDGCQTAKAPGKVWAGLRRRLGLLFQDGALFDSLTVMENVACPLWLGGQTDARTAGKKARTLLEDLDLGTGYLDLKPSDLSAGERKRAALARALILEPEMLFFDEPTTGLDPLLSAQVDDLILQVSRRTKATIIVISHDISATLKLADNLAMIHDGRIALSGPADTFRQSDNPVIKQFLAGSADGPLGFLD